MRMPEFWLLPAMLACVAAGNAVQGSAGENPPIALAQAARGMDFDVYIRLRQGMTEGELLERAGPPDYQTVDGSFRHKEEADRRSEGDRASTNITELTVKTFYYYPTVSNPFTTVVTTIGGRITDLQRTRKF